MTTCIIIALVGLGLVWHNHDKHIAVLESNDRFLEKRLQMIEEFLADDGRHTEPIDPDDYPSLLDL